MKNIIIYLVGALIIGVVAFFLFPNTDTTLFGVGVGVVIFIYSYFFRKWERKFQKN